MANCLAQHHYITTQIQLPLNLEVTFKLSDEVITFHNLVKDVDFNQFFIKRMLMILRQEEESQNQELIFLKQFCLLSR